MKWELDFWYELWDRAGSQGLDTWYEPRDAGAEEQAIPSPDACDGTSKPEGA